MKKLLLISALLCLSLPSMERKRKQPDVLQIDLERESSLATVGLNKKKCIKCRASKQLAKFQLQKDLANCIGACYYNMLSEYVMDEGCNNLTGILLTISRHKSLERIQEEHKKLLKFKDYLIDTYTGRVLESQSLLTYLNTADAAFKIHEDQLLEKE